MKSIEKTKLRRLLDMLLGGKWSVWGPVLLASLVWGLYALFGVSAGKAQQLMGAAFAGVFSFFGVFLVLGFQTRRTKDAGFAARYGGVLNCFTLMVLSGTVMAMLTGTAQCLADMGSFHPGNVIYPMAVGGIAWAHQQRRD